MSTLQDAVQKLLAIKKYNDKTIAILQLIIDGKMRLPDVEATLTQIKIKRITDLKDQLVNVMFDYIDLCLEDDVLTQSEMQDFQTLQRFFRIQEGDFIRCHKEREIKNVLTEQLRKIQSDKVVDKSEALMKNDLQAMFGLSYDQFLAIENEVSKESIKNGANPLDLDTFIKK
ncbi:MAG: hypothetical protein J6U04_00635 [Salinivirgaceae bacterium]|nr:hypothetical protein [Salinivirgaceae bacterium]